MRDAEPRHADARCHRASAGDTVGCFADPTVRWVHRFHLRAQRRTTSWSTPDRRRCLPAYPAFDVEAIRRDFPILQRARPRPPAGLARQRRHHAEAAGGHRPADVLLRARELQHPPGARTSLAARATDAYEGARPRCAASSVRLERTRSSSCAAPPKRINLVAQSWGRHNIGSGRRDRHLPPRAPRQHRAVAAAGGREGREAARHPGRRRRPDHARGLRRSAQRQDAAGRGHARVERARHDRAGRAKSSSWPTAPARGSWSTAPSPSPHMPVDVPSSMRTSSSSPATRSSRPTGIGAVYGKPEVLEVMPPWQGGGNMIADVTFERTTYQAPPDRFEAGTGNIADAVGLGAALDYVDRIGLENIGPLRARPAWAMPPHTCSSVPGLRLIGTRPGKGQRALVRARRATARGRRLRH